MRPSVLIYLCLIGAALAVPSSELKNDGSFRPSYAKDIQTSESRIVGGHAASRHQFPYQISLQYGLLIFSHICGGSVISPTHILTAAHCVSSSLLAGYRIVAGILNRRENTADTQTIRVSTFINHPGWPGGNAVAANDISLLRLASSLTYTSAVQPISLPQAGRDFSGTAVLSGWGLTSSSSLTSPNTLQWVEKRLLTNNECAAALISVLGTVGPLEDTMICTSGATGTSACSGDSGGPLAQNGLLVGVVSWGITPCGTVNAPSVFTRTSSFRDWIEANVNDLA